MNNYAEWVEIYTLRSGPARRQLCLPGRFLLAAVEYFLIGPPTGPPTRSGYQPIGWARTVQRSFTR